VCFLCRLEALFLVSRAHNPGLGHLVLIKLSKNKQPRIFRFAQDDSGRLRLLLSHVQNSELGPRQIDARTGGLHDFEEATSRDELQGDLNVYSFDKSNLN
jgi:hypothetical protein